MNTEGTQLLDSVFDHFMANGAHLFNATRLAPTEVEHCRLYHDFVQPAPNSMVVDLGCGIGEVNAWFQCFDPSLRSMNIVNDAALISKMQALGRPCLNASMDRTTLPDGFADVVMFNESIGYVSLEAAFTEAARLLRPSGILAIKDFSITDPAATTLHLENWDYTIQQPLEFLRAATNAGFSVQAVLHPLLFTKHWFDIMDKSDAARASAMRHDPAKLPICTVLYRFTKGALNGCSFDRS